MKAISSIKQLLPALAMTFITASYAAPEADPSLKLKEALRSTMLQLRKAQTDNANLQTAQFVAEAKQKELEAKIAELTKNGESLIKKSNADKAASEESISKLNNRLADRDQRIVQFNEALEKWKAGYQQAAEVARDKEIERAKLASQVVDLKNTVADREAKNISLFNTSMEILNRYENYALGKAITAREPFIGTTRVKVENLVQGYKDKIIDNRINAPASKPKL
jgi:chromosome segregation ATPase